MVENKRMDKKQMNICTRCSSTRVLSVHAHGRDCNVFQINGYEHEGYVPADFRIGSGDDVEFDMCLNCGQVQGEFPIKETVLETGQKYGWS